MRLLPTRPLLPLLAAAALLSPLLPNPTEWGGQESAALAHTVEVGEDIGATMHIEPSDNPRAGEETLAWFALVRAGGETVPLSACDCALTVTPEPGTATTDVQTPSLEAISAESYADIPGARFTFPAVGRYTLQLTGQPVTAEDFTAFDFTFDVTVAEAAPLPTVPSNDSATLPPPAEVTDPEAPDIQTTTWLAPILSVVAVLAVGTGIWLFKRR